ncbi:hypothetical protein RHMOL_Rhmol01G0026200 [Rhododendron molle]|uniref:Uncharacterized protein n=1 Tax=Rhododendron molle TaxID=49168 RepID=A0ACC0PYT2_RHOML|nr:hypothetical protein RHMOL_Rhmol01G0026200 [Rhododendron molle]
MICPNLKFLSVSECKRLTNLGIGEVLRRCPAITQLHINGLEVSDVFGCCSDHSVVNLKTLKARHTQNLQYLDIGLCKELTDKGVMEVVRNCERLRDIRLLRCEKVSSNILHQMVLSRPSLGNIDPPCFGDLSEQMTKKFLSLGCRLGLPPAGGCHSILL